MWGYLKNDIESAFLCMAGTYELDVSDSRNSKLASLPKGSRLMSGRPFNSIDPKRPWVVGPRTSVIGLDDTIYVQIVETSDNIRMPLSEKKNTPNSILPFINSNKNLERKNVLITNPYPNSLLAKDLITLMDKSKTYYEKSPLVKFAASFVQKYEHEANSTTSTKNKDNGEYHLYYDKSYLASIILTLKMTRPLDPLAQMAGSEYNVDYKILIPKIYDTIITNKSRSNVLNLTSEKCLEIKKDHIKIWNKICQLLDVENRQTAMFMPEYFIKFYDSQHDINCDKLRFLLKEAGIQINYNKAELVQEFEIWLLQLQN